MCDLTVESHYRAFSPLVVVGVAYPILVAMVTVLYIMKEERLEGTQHKLEQPFRSYCHQNIGIFVYNPTGGVQLLYTNWVTHSFSMMGCKYSNTYNFSLSTANHLIIWR